MLIPNKLLKSKENKAIPDQTRSHYNYISKLYNSNHRKIKDDPARYRANVIDWLFSYDTITRLKLVTIDNAFVSKLIQFLFKRKYSNKSIGFSYNDKPDEPKLPAAELSQLLYSECKYSYSKKEMTQMESMRRDNLEEEILRLFQPGVLDTSQSAEYQLFSLQLCNELKFFNLYDHLDAVALSPCLLSEKKRLLEYMDFYSDGKCFGSPVKSHIYKDKFISFDLPDWLEKGRVYDIGSFVVGLFEQMISIRYVLYRHLNGSNKPKYIHGLVDPRVEEVFEARRRNILFLMRKYPKEQVSNVSSIK